MPEWKIGLLPLYLKLYDDVSQESRPRMQDFVDAIAGVFSARGIAVEKSGICRIEPEFESAVTGFESAGVDAIVTLHLAYSPSLESSTVLARTRLPILVLDTTPTWAYGPTQDPVELMFNHGIHGVQDMCNLLVRNGKTFIIEAGHWEKSDVIDRVIRHLPSARAASIMGRGRVGLLGRAFQGMGDFATTPERLAATIGGTVKTLGTDDLGAFLKTVRPEEVESEMSDDRKTFDTAGIDTETHRLSVHLGLALRRWVAKEKLAAFTFNFQSTERKAGFPTVPFLEASKALSRGIGYAGEGDVMTALLVAAVASMHPESTFTEMFCPDWESGAIYLSHMGEVNWRLCEGKAVLREMDYKYGDAANPAFVTGCFKGGEIVLVNLAPTSETKYRLILAPATMTTVRGEDRMANSVRGWFKPALPLQDFLAEYSRQGGTHHLALAYTASVGDLKDFARLMGWEIVEIG